MIPVGARVGIGALAVALAAGSGLISPAGLVAVVSAATAVVAWAGTRSGPAGRPRAAGAALAGAWLLTARILLSGGWGQAPQAGVPEGPGPWVARVTALGTPREGTQRLTVVLDDAAATILAVTAPRYPAVEPGDRVRLAGRPAPPPVGSYGDFLRRTGVVGTLRSADLAILARVSDAAGFLERTRRAAGDALARALPEPAAGLAAGILVGLRDRVDRDLAAAFTATGLSHVVAISGWNIALVAGLVGAALAGRARRTRSCAILVAIVGYTVLAGASASVVRASAMAGVALLARESGRPGTAAAALGWAVALLVLAVPASAADVGLQLSAAATAGLIAWSRPLSAVIERRAAWLPGWIREGLGVSLAAQAATLPIVLLAFGRVAPLSPLTNLAVVPLVPAAMATGALALVGGALAAVGGPGIAAVLAGLPGAFVLGLLIAIVRVAATIPLASVTLPPAVAAGAAGVLAAGLAAVALRHRLGPLIGHLRPPGAHPPVGGAAARPRRRVEAGPAEMHGGVAGRVAATPGGVATTPGPRRSPASRPARPRPKRLLRAAVALATLALAVLVVAAATRPDGRAHVVVLDVGQGDAILVTGPNGGRMLVDGGPDPDRLLVSLDARVPPWDRRIDLVVLTHPHEDHVAGLPLVLERYRVGRVVESGMPGIGPGYEAFAAGTSARGAAPGRLVSGDRLVLDGVVLDVLWPDADRVPAQASDVGSRVNDASIVLLGTFEGRRFLLTGDAQADVEELMVERGLGPVDLLKAGHHGSSSSTTGTLVAAARPMLAAVSVGARNDYGHPSREVITRLAAAGAMVLRTDEVGTVDVALGAAGIGVHTERRIPRATPDASHVAPIDPNRKGAGRRVALSYDRLDASLPRGRRLAPAVARPARLAHPPRARRRRDRRMARRPVPRTRCSRRPRARRGGGPPPRRRQGDPALRRRLRPGARRGVGRVADGSRACRPCRGGCSAPGDAPAGSGRGTLARRRPSRGAPGRLCRQARRPAP